MKIEIDLDKDRIKEIVVEALRIIREDFKENFLRKEEEILKNLEEILKINRISYRFYIFIPTRNIPDLRLRIDPVKRKVLCKSFFKDKAAKLNYLLKVL